MARLPVDFTDSSGNLADQLVPQAEQNINANFIELYAGTAVTSGTYTTLNAGTLSAAVARMTTSGTTPLFRAARFLADVGGTVSFGQFSTVGTSTTNIGKLAIQDENGTTRYIPCLLP